ncbi:hypothetical protein HF086_001685 [Spodoptera exigua]|uniref:Uncharacterized protein n=1 Tax=Spodoptera exigua TaxID=7107 RepID=A0A922MPN0_SPOEX|nr:hypothetical protein HF086_001685 [Spodoptera exigua]
MAAPDATLQEYFRKYNPPIRPHKHTCVGLAMEVEKTLKVLEKDFPGISKSMMIVSCDENIQDLMDYATFCPGPQGFLIETEKDHVMLAINVKVDGRPGMFLSDLGYHIARVVTVMVDRCYPHTGWFTQSDEPHCRKEYNYQFNLQNSNYIEWHERETRGTVVKERLSLVYVAKAYLTAVSVTEKRNIVWDLSSPFLKYQNDVITLRELFIPKPNVNHLLHKQLTIAEIPDEVVDEVEQCNDQLRLRDGELLSILNKLATIMSDEEYMVELMEINDKIVQLSAGN